MSTTPLQVAVIGPADVYAVASGSLAGVAWQVTHFHVGTPGFEAGGWRCNCPAGQHGQPCRHVEAVKTELAANPTQSIRRHLRPIRGGQPA